jgi:hypothetical protein
MHQRICQLVTAVRLTIGYCAHEKVTLSQADLEALYYRDLCELSEMLDLPPARLEA